MELGQARATQNRPKPRHRPRCTFDHVSSSNFGASVTSQDVLLVAGEQGLDVYDVSRKDLALTGCIRNIRGSVITAKVVPSLSLEDSTSKRFSMVILVIHGPCVVTSAPMDQTREEGGQDEFDASDSMIQALESAGSDLYQTTVEVYSLTDSQHLTTLFSSPKIQSHASRWIGKPMPPPPFGALSVQAKGSFITISSGLSGEVYFYEYSSSLDKNLSVEFHCIGKTWTSIAARSVRSSSMSSRESGQMQEEDEGDLAPDQAIVSLGPRWLAIVPPLPSDQTTIHGQVPVSRGKKVPGLSSHTAPEQPPVTCQLDTPLAESFFNRMARDATQEFVKGARWVGSQGVQAWNKYWSKPPDQGQHDSGQADAHPMAPPPQPYFPPTHAQDSISTRAKNGPALVSILDLETLSQSQQWKDSVALQPVATFSLPNGCSTLSFAPNGIQMFTASSKGDVQQVWDLMQIMHGENERTGRAGTNITGPVVREIARFTRITEARIIDIAWAHPNGQTLALATDKGTIHVYDLPPSAFYWPPLRRSKRVFESPAKEAQDESKSNEKSLSELPGGGLGSAFGMIAGKTQPLISAVRGRTASTGSSLPGFSGFTSTASAGAKSGKAVAVGINRSFTAAATGTVNTFRHLGENRINLPGFSKSLLVGCMNWRVDKGETLLAVTATGLVRVHTVRQGTGSTAGRRRSSAVGSKPYEMTVPQTSEGHPSSRNAVEQGTRSPPESFWKGSTSRPPSRLREPDTHPLSYAEIETHAPYQPFHTDRRVNFHIYSKDSTPSDEQAVHSEDPWIFGEPLPSTQISLAPSSTESDDIDDDERGPVQMENVVRSEGNEEDGQQILVTTRRKRPRKGAEEDFFEDDLEVVEFAQDRV